MKAFVLLGVTYFSVFLIDNKQNKWVIYWKVVSAIGENEAGEQGESGRGL